MPKKYKKKASDRVWRTVADVQGAMGFDPVSFPSPVFAVLFHQPLFIFLIFFFLSLLLPIPPPQAGAQQKRY